MHLIINHVSEFYHIGDSDSCRLVKIFTRSTISEVGLSISWKSGLIGIFANIIQRSSVNDRSGELKVKHLTSPSKNSLVNLPHVHTCRYAKRIKNDIYN